MNFNTKFQNLMTAYLVVQGNDYEIGPFYNMPHRATHKIVEVIQLL